MMPLALRMAPVTAHQDRQLNGLASPPTSTALGSQVRSGSSWPLSGSCTEKQLPTDTPRPTASFDPCHRPLVPRRACVEPRPLVQTGPQGDSLPACGTRRRRRPSRLERARRREAHWTVAASPRLEKAQSRVSRQLESTLPSSVCSDRRSLSSHHEFGYSSFSWSARARALVSTPALAAARSSYRPAAKGPREDRRAPAPPFPCGST